jgi:hypothetical protein
MRTFFSGVNVPLPEKFWARVDKTNGCWNWIPKSGKIGPLRNQEYGYFHIGGGKYVRAHRFAYELANGPIPSGLLVLHSCDNQRCVNPAHLRAGTQGENAREAVERGRMRPHNKVKTHCIHGHEFSPQNTIRRGTHRQCRACLYACINRRRAAIKERTI